MRSEPTPRCEFADRVWGLKWLLDQKELANALIRDNGMPLCVAYTTHVNQHYTFLNVSPGEDRIIFEVLYGSPRSGEFVRLREVDITWEAVSRVKGTWEAVSRVKAMVARVFSGSFDGSPGRMPVRRVIESVEMHRARHGCRFCSVGPYAVRSVSCNVRIRS